MKKSFLVAVSILALSSCASVLKGSKQIVSINSNVQGADIFVNGSHVGQTPFTGEVKRNSSTTVQIQKTGYEPKKITLDTKIEPIFWGNIIIGGVFGSSTDYGTGAMYKYAPSTVQVDLAPSGK